MAEPVTASAPRRRTGWIVFGCALAVRVAYLAWLRSDEALFAIRGVDTRAYLVRAAEIAGGAWTGGGTFHSAFLYPYFLALAGGRIAVATLVQMVLDAGSAVLVWRLARRAAGEPAALAAGLLYAFGAVPVFASATLLFDPMGVLFVLGGLDAFHSALDRPSLARWSGAAFLLALAATARPFLLVFPVLVLAVLLRKAVPRAQLATAAIGLAVGVGIVLVPIGLANLRASGEFRVAPPSGGLAFYLGNNPLADGTLVFPSHLGVQPGSTAFTESALAYPSRRLGRPVTASEASGFWFREGLAFWRAQPLRALALTGRKALMLVNAAEVGDNYDFALARERVPLLRWLPGALAVLALAPWGILLALRRRVAGWVLAMAALHAAILPLFFITGRLRYALLALLCVFAGLAVVDLSSRVRERRWRSLALAAAVVGAGGAVALLPHAPLRAGPAPQARGQLAAALLGSGRGSEALTVVEEALAETPTARLQTLRGDILRQLGRPADALDAYRRAIDLDRRADAAHRGLEQIASVQPSAPEQELLREGREGTGPGPSLALARLYLGQERCEAAVTWARKAVESGGGDEALFLLAVAEGQRGRPGDSVPLYAKLLARTAPNPMLLTNLGFALFDDGRVEEARQRFEEALALDGRFAQAHWGLGLVHKFAGRFELARLHYREFIALEPPDSRWIAVAEKNLREMDRY